jgi:hypothetical protein
MRVLATILQCKRVVLPHLFVRHAWPAMRERLGGGMDVLLVQHAARAPEPGRRHGHTGHLPEDRLDEVRRWTRAGRYPGARILRHEEWFDRYPSLPSYRRAVEAALEGGYDLHLWLEDDAFVYDPACDAWADRMVGHDVGVFGFADEREDGGGRHRFVQVSHLLTTPAFDRRILRALRQRRGWDRGARLFGRSRWRRRGPKRLDPRRIEPRATRLARSPARLDPGCAGKHHRGATAELHAALSRIVPPDALTLLAHDGIPPGPDGAPLHGGGAGGQPPSGSERTPKCDT